MVKNTQKQIQSVNQQQFLNQRQFKCKCLKVYKSYPALYTHIKNKHFDQIQQFKSQSKRPKQGQIDKGRPKKHRDRPIQVDEQGQLLNIIQLGILQIDKNLRNQTYTNNTSQRFQILQGNAKLKQQDLKRHYDDQKSKVIKRMKQPLAEDDDNEVIRHLYKYRVVDLKNESIVKIFKQQIKFKNELIQHFNAITAAKILIELQLLQIQQNGEDENMNDNSGIDFKIDRKELIKLGEQSLWGNNSKIIRVIRNIDSEWKQKVNKIQNSLRNKHHNNDLNQQQYSNSQQEQNQNEQQYQNKNKYQNKEQHQDKEQYENDEQHQNEQQHQNKEQQSHSRQIQFINNNNQQNDFDDCFN